MDDGCDTQVENPGEKNNSEQQRDSLIRRPCLKRVVGVVVFLILFSFQSSCLGLAPGTEEDELKARQGSRSRSLLHIYKICISYVGRSQRLNRIDSLLGMARIYALKQRVFVFV